MFKQRYIWANIALQQLPVYHENHFIRQSVFNTFVVVKMNRVRIYFLYPITDSLLDGCQCHISQLRLCHYDVIPRDMWQVGEKARKNHVALLNLPTPSFHHQPILEKNKNELGRRQSLPCLPSRLAYCWENIL